MDGISKKYAKVLDKVWIPMYNIDESYRDYI